MIEQLALIKARNIERQLAEAQAFMARGRYVMASRILGEALREIRAGITQAENMLKPVRRV